jgi:hypothetical protein
VKVLIGYLLVTSCASQPFWTPRAGSIPAHDGRRDLLGTWSVELVADTVDSFVRRYNPTVVSSHGVQTPAAVGSFQLLDSLAPDRAGFYARVDGNFLSLLCYKNYGSHVVEIALSREADRVHMAIPGWVAQHDFSSPTLFVHARYFPDSIVGAWEEGCSSYARTRGKVRMVRTSNAN